MKQPFIISVIFYFLLVLSNSNYTQVNNQIKTQEQTGSITVQVFGFENDKGKARLLVFTEKMKEYFPSEQDSAFIRRVLPIEDSKVVFQLDSLPYGDYAVSVHHDENNDDRVNSNWLGIPKEGLGASNDAKGFFGPPSFEKAKITLNKPEMSITINMVN
ncbi:MAG: DUF2141 domain-containing protein [bacterium]